MKVIILNSPLFRVKNRLYDEDSLPPIGLGIIATQLKNKGLDVSLIDAVADNIPLIELLNSMQKQEPSVIATNIFTTNYELVKDLIEGIKIDVRFIIGGLSTKSLYEEIFNWKTHNSIDIVHGDGEFITYDIISNSLQQKPNVEKDGRRFFVVDNSSTYFARDISNIPLNRSFFKNEPVHHLFGFEEANIITSRGCIYNCAFCAAASSLNREFGTREKDALSIIAEIRHLKEVYPNLESIRVLDDLFLKKSDTVLKAIDVFKNFNLQWRSMAHVLTFRDVDENTVRKLKESGCNELFIGIESGSPRVLKQIHKHPNVEQIKENLSKLLRNGINVKGYFIYGFPNETVEDFEMTYALAEYLKNVSVKYGSRFRTSVFQFRPYHGTELYHGLEKEYGDNAFAQVSSVEPNKELSDLVGRLQFNFHSGNYASAEPEIVQNFIYKTTNLNPIGIFAAHAGNKGFYNSNKAV